MLIYKFNYTGIIISEHLLHPPRIVVGSPQENPVILNRNDAVGQRAIWAQEEIYGKWQVHVKEGQYDIQFKFIEPVAGGGRMYLEAGTLIMQKENELDATDVIDMQNVYLPAMDCDLIPFYIEDRKYILPFWVQLKKLD